MLIIGLVVVLSCFLLYISCRLFLLYKEKSNRALLVVFSLFMLCIATVFIYDIPHIMFSDPQYINTVNISLINRRIFELTFDGVKLWGMNDLLSANMITNDVYVKYLPTTHTIISITTSSGEMIYSINGFAIILMAFFICLFVGLFYSKKIWRVRSR